MKMFGFMSKSVNKALNVINWWKKIFMGILFICALCFFPSFEYKIIVLMVGAFCWRKSMNKYVFRGALGILAICLWMVLPRYSTNSSDRVQLMYQNKDGERINAPALHYLINVLFPEEEVMNIGIWGARLGAPFMPVGGTLLDQFKSDDAQGKIDNFYNPVRNLNMGGEFCMSGTTSQVCNMFGIGSKTKSVYVIKPNGFDASKEYPLVFFCHGYLGNWRLYQGVFNNLDSCIVMSVGTTDLSGIYTHKDIKELFTKQIPFLEKQGFKVDRNNVHIIGLSNGGTASNIAYRDFSKKFKTITYLSTGIDQTYKIKSKVLLIGGGKDGSSASLRPAFVKLRKNGAKTNIYWEDDETHYIMMNCEGEIIDFLAHEYGVKADVDYSMSKSDNFAWGGILGCLFTYVTLFAGTMLFMLMAAIPVIIALIVWAMFSIAIRFSHGRIKIRITRIWLSIKHSYTSAKKFIGRIFGSKAVHFMLKGCKYIGITAVVVVLTSLVILAYQPYLYSGKGTEKPMFYNESEIGQFIGMHVPVCHFTYSNIEGIDSGNDEWYRENMVFDEPVDAFMNRVKNKCKTDSCWKDTFESYNGYVFVKENGKESQRIIIVFYKDENKIMIEKGYLDGPSAGD